MIILEFIIKRAVVYPVWDFSLVITLKKNKSK